MVSLTLATKSTPKKKEKWATPAAEAAEVSFISASGARHNPPEPANSGQRLENLAPVPLGLRQQVGVVGRRTA